MKAGPCNNAFLQSLFGFLLPVLQPFSGVEAGLHDLDACQTQEKIDNDNIPYGGIKKVSSEIQEKAYKFRL